jgi:hypothetical protein
LFKRSTARYVTMAKTWSSINPISCLLLVVLATLVTLYGASALKVEGFASTSGQIPGPQGDSNAAEEQTTHSKGAHPRAAGSGEAYIAYNVSQKR